MRHYFRSCLPLNSIDPWLFFRVSTARDVLAGNAKSWDQQLFPRRALFIRESDEEHKASYFGSQSLCGGCNLPSLHIHSQLARADESSSLQGMPSCIVDRRWKLFTFHAPISKWKKRKIEKALRRKLSLIIVAGWRCSKGSKRNVTRVCSSERSTPHLVPPRSTRDRYRDKASGTEMNARNQEGVRCARYPTVR